MKRTPQVREGLVFLIVISILLSACSSGAPSASVAAAVPGVISIVAAENFYGDIVKQIGGSHVSVTSILSDPNIDPHEYESNVQNGVAVSEAQLVVQNGDGYDTWMDKLLSASPNPQRVVLVAANIAPDKLPDNAHVWYGLDNIQAIASQMTNDLEKIDPADKTAFEDNLSIFQKSLVPIQQKMDSLKANYAGTPVGLTETIFLYQTAPIGLKVMTPFEFEKAVAQGNDPPADTVVTANDQINQHEIKVLIYNVQTVTPLTTNLNNEAQKAAIPVVAVSESMPAGKTYQEWMMDQLNTLEQALVSIRK